MNEIELLQTKGGGRNMASRHPKLWKILAESIEESGGQIIYEKKIEKIVLKDRAVSGVITSEGKHLPAKIVISNANATTTLNNMLPSGTLPPDYMNTINGYGISLSTFVIWLGLNREIHESVKDSHIVISSGRGVEASYISCLKGDVDKMDVSVTIYDNYYKGYSKPGTSTVTIITGFPFSVDNSFMNRIKNRTPIKGLYLASAYGYAGSGYAPGLKGGERTFEQVLEDLA